MKLAIICATLFAAAVQARDFILMDGASSRTRVYLFSQEGQEAPQLIREVNTQLPGGEQGLQVAITDDHDKNVKYFEELLKPLAASERSDSPYDVYIYGSGSIRRETEEKQARIWTHVRSAIDVVAAPNKFVVRAAETIPAEDESALMFKMLAGKPKTGLVEIGGEYLQAGLDSDNESFDNVGSVGASGAFAKNLLDSQDWSEDYYKVVDKLTEDKKKSEDLLVEVQGDGRLAKFAQKIVHPCLMKAKNPLDMIEAKSIKKSPKHMYSEVIPFVGNTFLGTGTSGTYDACFAAIATHIDKAVVGKHVPSIPTDFSLVGLGTLYYNQLNLKKLGITIKTVGDVVAAAKTVCAYDFSDKYEDKSLKISPWGLVELCWVSTHAATVLKHLLELDDAQTFEQLTDKGWVLGMAQLIASNAASQEDFKYQPAIKA